MNTQQRINSLIRSAFRRYGYPQLEAIWCRLERGTVILYGELSTMHLKQVAETIARSVPQVQRVENRISLRESPQPASTNCETDD
ncbi:BON domain-containing protein [Aeoliella straminimaris]|uniref:BON domain-containing protein n=1 Tax=Aeoliella straminimaris TaxID=2954799 RepID=UPI003CC50DDE